MDFGILGPLEARSDGAAIDLGRPKQRALLARLLISANQVVSTDRLVEDLWADGPPADGPGALQIQVSRLRRALATAGPAGERILESRKPGYVLHVTGDELDTNRFTTLVAEGRRALEDGRPDVAVERLTTALALWRGPALVEFVDDPFAVAEAVRLEELRLTATEERFDAELALGHHTEVAAELRRLVGEHPARERLWGQLILALYRSGRQAEALRAYGEVRRWLGEELGIDPSSTLRRLEEAVLLQRAELDWVPPRRPEGGGATGLGGLAGGAGDGLEAERREGPLVGREEPLARLRAAWEQARSGGPALVLVAGEPGVGKTRLVAELADEARDGGALVLVGRCDQELAVPYQPFAEALAPILRSLPVEEISRWLGGRAAELARLLPQLTELLADLPPPLRADPETEAFRLFESVVAALAGLADQSPVLLVLDDLHWAARQTVLLLRHLVGRAGTMPVLVVATYRDTEPGVEPLPDVAGGAAPAARVAQVRLQGLDPAAVAALAASLTGHEGDPEVARRLHAATAGNPLFVREVVRDLAEAGAPRGHGGPVAAPEGVHAVVRQRLSRLSDPASQLLGTAAVIGTEYDLAVLEAASTLDEDRLLGGLEEAVHAGLVTDAPGLVLRQRFTHALVKDVLYDRLPPARRASLHGRVGRALEQVHAGRLSEHLPELARHFVRAGSLEAATKGVAYSRQAGDRASGQLADEEAVLHYRHALDLLEVAGAPDPALRADLLLALGTAQQRCGAAEHRQTLLDAARAAAELGDPERLARAALANSRGFWSASGAVDGERVATLQAALAALGDDDTALRARLLANLAVELVWAGDLEAVRRLSDQALAMARRVGDLPTLAAVLAPRYNAVRGDPATLAGRLADTAELLAVAEQLPDPSLRCMAWGWRAVAAMEATDVEEADHSFEVFARLAGELRQPTLLWYSAYLHASRVLLAGRFAEAQQASLDACRLGQAAGQPDAEMFLLAQGIQVAFEQGTLGDWVQGLLADIGRQPGSDRFLRSWQSLVLCELDRDDDARRSFEALAAADFADLGFEPVWLHVVANCAAVCAHLGDARRAALLVALLEPYGDQLVTMCSLTYSGSVRHYLGLLHATMGDVEAAGRHFSEAAAVHERIGAPAWLARTRTEWGRALLSSGDRGERHRGLAMVEQAAEVGRSLGAATVVSRAEALLGAPSITGGGRSRGRPPAGSHR